MVGSFPVLSHEALQANPSALHKEGVALKRALSEARTLAAKAIGAHSDEIVFTSNATESDNLAILGSVKYFLQHGITPQEIGIYVSPFEHAAVSESLASLHPDIFVCTLLHEEGYLMTKKIVLQEGLKAKFTAVNTKDGLGGIINSIIAFGIGIGGVLAVAMIMYEGFLYMKEKKEGNVEKVSSAKTRITNTVLGFLLLLSIYVILRTINPELLNLTPRIDASSLDVQDRADNPDFVKNVDSIDDSNITLPPGDYSDESFLAYLAHQQGAGGAAAILWSAKKGKSTVPTPTPFTTGDIQKNIGTNCPSGCSKTPAGFVDYWRKKVAASKALGSTNIPPEIDDALKKASDDRGTDIATMRAICRIESYTGCTRMAALSNHNSYGYAGLFQLSNSLYQKTSGVWEQYRKGTDSIIFNAYDNAYAAAGLMKYNIGQMKKYWSKINE
jgi:hypothetical protein